MKRKGVELIEGNLQPKANEKVTFKILKWFKDTPPADINPSEVTWELYKMRRNGKYTTTNIRKKGISSFTFGEGAVGSSYLLKAYRYSPANYGLYIKPQHSRVPKIEKIELFYVDDKPGEKFSFHEKLRTKATCTNMLGKEVVFQLWEDDAPGSRQDGGNDPLAKPIKKPVNEKGIAIAEFPLNEAVMRLALKNEKYPDEFEFFVTVELPSYRKHNSENVVVENPESAETKAPVAQTPPIQTPPKPIPQSSPSVPTSSFPKTNPAPAPPTQNTPQKPPATASAPAPQNNPPRANGTASGTKPPTIQQNTTAPANINTAPVSTPKICECEQFGLIWGKKVSCKFRKKVVAIAKDLWPNDVKNMANNLMAVFAWETGETFKPDTPNQAGSGATGLIQFMPERATEYFGKCTMETVPNYFNSTNPKLHNLPRIIEFAQMTAEDQLDYVKKYFEPLKGKKMEFVDFYLQVLFPVSSGQPEHYVFGTSKYKNQIGLSTDSDSVRQKRVDKFQKNAGLDIDKNERISKSEIALSVQPYITKGLPEIFIKGKKNNIEGDKKDASDAVVVTDAGHGINGDGGNSKKGNPDSESKMTLMIEAETAKSLVSKKIKNVRTRTTESLSVATNQITYRVNVAKENKAKVFVSHHLDYVPLNKDGTVNERGAKSTNRIVVNIHPQNLVNEKGQAISGGASDAFYKNSSSLANLIVTELKTVFNDRDVIVKQAKRPNISHDWLGVLKNMDGSNRAAVLIELGNTTEANTKFLTDNKQAIGTAIATGVEKYLGNAQKSSSAISEECENESPIKPVIEKEVSKEEGSCEYCHKEHFDLTSKVKWQTQFDPKWGDKKKQNVACKKTCDDILINSGLKATSPGSLYQTAIENKNHTLIIINTENSKQAIAYMNSELKKGHPVQLGVDHKLGYGYNEGTTDHFVVVIGKGCDNGKIYYRFYDVGTRYQEKGASANNKLFLGSDNSLKGTTVYSGQTYTVTQVRKNL